MLSILRFALGLIGLTIIVVGAVIDPARAQAPMSGGAAPSASQQADGLAAQLMIIAAQLQMLKQRLQNDELGMKQIADENAKLKADKPSAIGGMTKK